MPEASIRSWRLGSTPTSNAIHKPTSSDASLEHISGRDAVANMVINPTYLAQRTRSSATWNDARQRVIQSYRDWIRAVCGPQELGVWDT